MTTRDPFHLRLRYALKYRGHSLSQLAEEAGMDKGRVSHVIRGRDRASPMTPQKRRLFAAAARMLGPGNLDLVGELIAAQIKPPKED